MSRFGPPASSGVPPNSRQQPSQQMPPPQQPPYAAGSNYPAQPYAATGGGATTRESRWGGRAQAPANAPGSAAPSSYTSQQDGYRSHTSSSRFGPSRPSGFGAPASSAPGYVPSAAPSGPKVQLSKLTDLDKGPALEIPIRGSDKRETEDSIVISLEELATMPLWEIASALKAEDALLWRWLRFAAAYVRIGMLEQALGLLDECDSMEARARFASDVDGRALVQNAMAGIKIMQAKLVRERDQSVTLANAREQDQAARQAADAIGALLNQAERHLQEADRLSQSDRVQSVVLTTRGELYLDRGSLDVALSCFNNALDRRPASMRATIGKAGVLFHKQQYKEAKDLYARIIKAFPGEAPAATRVALGLCYYELNKDGRAQECFERALELDPTHVDAQVALAVLEMGLASDSERAPGSSKEELLRNQERTKQLSTRALARLEAAYARDEKNPVVLTHLANYFFHKKDRDHVRAETLAQAAFKATANDKIKAEAAYIVGRNAHFAGNYPQALKAYTRSLEIWAGFHLARFALAQMELARPEPDVQAALRAVQTVVDTPEHADDVDAQLLLGSLLARTKNVEPALKALRKVTDKDLFRADAWAEQAMLEQSRYRLSATSAEEAIRAYEKCATALGSKGLAAPAELHSNVAALKLRLDNYKDALAALTRAYATVVQNGKIEDLARTPTSTTPPLAPELLTFAFNYGRALELSGAQVQAEKVYQLIKTSHPYYVDATLRLAHIAKTRGLLSEAEDYIKEALLQHPGHTDTLIHYGNLDLLRGALRPAEQKFKQVVKESKHDQYARLALANMDLEASQSSAFRAIASNDPDKAKKLLAKDQAVSRALGVYRTVLKNNMSSVFAANGIGAAQAVRTRFESSRLILDKVREFADSRQATRSVLLNTAHVDMHEGYFDRAASLYEQASKRFMGEKDTETSMYHAAALYNAKRYPEARGVLLEALRHAPWDDALWYSSALVDEAEALQKLTGFDIHKTTRSRELLQQILRSLERASETYSWIYARGAATSSSQSAQAMAANAIVRVKVWDTLAKSAYESSVKVELAHRPSEPPTDGASVVAAASPELLAVARANLSELSGKAPAAEDLAVRDAEKARLLAELTAAAEAAASPSNRPQTSHRDVEERAGRVPLTINRPRRPPQSNALRMSNSATRRLESVQNLLRECRSISAEHDKLDRLEDENRRKEEEARAAVVRSREAQLAAELEAERLEAKQRSEKAARIAEENKALALELAEQNARKSARERTKSTRLRDAEESGGAGKRGGKRGRAANQYESDGSSEAGNDSEDEEEEEEEIADSEDELDVGPADPLASTDDPEWSSFGPAQKRACRVIRTAILEDRNKNELRAIDIVAILEKSEGNEDVASLEFIEDMMIREAERDAVLGAIQNVLKEYPKAKPSSAELMLSLVKKEVDVGEHELLAKREIAAGLRANTRRAQAATTSQSTPSKKRTIRQAEDSDDEEQAQQDKDKKSADAAANPVKRVKLVVDDDSDDDAPQPKEPPASKSANDMEEIEEPPLIPQENEL